MKRRFRLAFFGIIAFQVLFLAGLTAFNEITLRFGETVVLQTVPVDPRDLFRGDFVVLRCEISTLRGRYRGGEIVYVHLVQRGDVWVATGVARERNPDWDVAIKGKVRSTTPGSVLEMEYGIENYFVPEGEGREIERAQDIKVEVSVNGFGDAVIKGLIVDGEAFRLR